MKISLVVPVFNEEATIPIFYKTVREFEGLQQHEVEIVFINDGSKDATESIINELCGNDYNKIDAKTAFEAKRQGDLIGSEIVETYVRDLGEGVINFINIFQPEVLLIGGGVSH